jgi:hypothetical protein
MPVGRAEEISTHPFAMVVCMVVENEKWWDSRGEKKK